MNESSGNFPDKGGFAMPLERRSRDLVVPPRSALVAFDTAQNATSPGAGFDINDIIRTVVKWRWLIAGMTLACVLGSIVISLLIVPTYQGTVVLEINREPTRVLEDNADVAPSQGSDLEFLSTQLGLLQSRSLAERVARALNLGNDENFVAQDGGRRVDREAIAVGTLRGNLTAKPQRNTRLVNVSYTSPDPQAAARIANAFAENFIQFNMENRYAANNDARAFLQNKLASVKASLEKSERDVVNYAQRAGILQLGGGGGATTGANETSLDANSLVQLNAALSAARGDRIAAEQRYRQVAGQRSTAIQSSGTVQGLIGQKAQLEAEYQEKSSLFKPEFPLMVQLRARINALDRSISNETGNVSGALSSSLRAEFTSAVARENALEARVAGLRSNVMDLRRRSIQYTILQREADTNRALYDSLLNRYKEVGVAGGIGTNLVGIVDRAQTPGGPIAPNLPLNVLLGLALGLVLGFGSAFAIEFIDDTIKTPDDLTNKLKLTPLGLIPKGGKDVPLIELLSDPRAPITEAYHSVRTALQFASDHGVPKTLLITSTRAAEGKSSSAMALAQNFARLGASVLLIDSDLRKPSFRAPSAATEGLSNLLAGATNIRECIHKTTFDRLFLLPSGPIPPNPAELLSTDRFRAILAEVSGWFDYVVIDAPPVLGLADAPLLSAVCEGTLMVFEASKVRRGVALNAVNRLRAADANLLGGVLTKYNAKSSGYGYGYAYTNESYSYGIGEERQRQIELIA